VSLLSQDIGAEQPGDKPVPLTLRQLLADLGMLRASEREQRLAVEAWLGSHEPNKVLALNLRRHSFTLDRRTAVA